MAQQRDGSKQDRKGDSARQKRRAAERSATQRARTSAAEPGVSVGQRPVIGQLRVAIVIAAPQRVVAYRRWWTEYAEWAACLGSDRRPRSLGDLVRSTRLACAQTAADRASVYESSQSHRQSRSDASGARRARRRMAHRAATVVGRSDRHASGCDAKLSIKSSSRRLPPLQSAKDGAPAHTAVQSSRTRRGIARPWLSTSDGLGVARMA